MLGDGTLASIVAVNLQGCLTIHLAMWSTVEGKTGPRHDSLTSLITGPVPSSKLSTAS